MCTSFILEIMVIVHCPEIKYYASLEPFVNKEILANLGYFQIYYYVYQISRFYFYKHLLLSSEHHFPLGAILATITLLVWCDII